MAQIVESLLLLFLGSARQGSNSLPGTTGGVIGKQLNYKSQLQAMKSWNGSFGQ
jgi:hypothetical protein